MKLYGALEAGGTKMVLAIVTGQGELISEKNRSPHWESRASVRWI